MKGLKKGSRVRIKNYAANYNGRLATVTRIDGAYVYVYLDCQPKNKKYPLELLVNEVEKI